jgi:ligand-binding SRPBCC domain-containing protein
LIHVLETHQRLRRPIPEVFPFFADAANLERLTPPELRFEILTPLPIEMREGTRIEYRLRLFGLPFRWRTRIAIWDPPLRFVDVQERGPYRLWEHSHHFAPDGDGARVDDRVRYQLPLRPFGEIAHPLVRRQLERIFAYRTRVLSERFGAGADRSDGGPSQPPGQIDGGRRPVAR